MFDDLKNEMVSGIDQQIQALQNLPNTIDM